jgi:hypothetical protein
MFSFEDFFDPGRALLETGRSKDYWLILILRLPDIPSVRTVAAAHDAVADDGLLLVL